MNRKTTSLLLWLGVIIVVGAIIWGLVALSQNTSTASGSVGAVTAQDWTRGKADAPVTLIEYGDFQCPACGSYYPVVESLLQDHADTVRYVFREYPLSSIHPNAYSAAQAAEAAGKQGKFWEMYNDLYTNQNDWAEQNNAKSIFEGYAKDLGVKVDQWNTDFASTKAKIGADIASGDAAGVDGTPSFFVNGKRITNPNTKVDFAKVLDDAIAAAKQQTNTNATNAQ